MNESSTAFARLADQARRRIEEISPLELDRAKPLPVIIDVPEPELEIPNRFRPRINLLKSGWLRLQFESSAPPVCKPALGANKDRLEKLSYCYANEGCTLQEYS